MRSLGPSLARFAHASCLVALLRTVDCVHRALGLCAAADEELQAQQQQLQQHPHQQQKVAGVESKTVVRTSALDAAFEQLCLFVAHLAPVEQRYAAALGRLHAYLACEHTLEDPLTVSRSAAAAAAAKLVAAQPTAASAAAVATMQAQIRTWQRLTRVAEVLGLPSPAQQRRGWRVEECISGAVVWALAAGDADALVCALQCGFNADFPIAELGDKVGLFLVRLSLSLSSIIHLQPALLFASERGDVAVVQALLEKKAKTEIRGDNEQVGFDVASPVDR